MRKTLVFSMIIMALLIAISACGSKPSGSPSASNPDSGTHLPDMKGTITALEGHRALIVDKVPDQPDNTNPTAIWVDFSAAPEALKDVRIGYRVKAWSLDGVMLESYPMQTKGKKLEIESSDMGSGDLQGTVTGIQLDGTDATKSSIEVDGNKLSLLPATVYWDKDNLADAHALHVGDKVEVWFPGYRLMEEKPVTQIRRIG